jgi:hypothetical protein
MVRRHPRRPQRPATDRASPSSAAHARVWQQQLDKRLAEADTHAERQWWQLVATEIPSATTDPFLPALAKAEQPHPGRIRRRPPRSVGGRCRTPTRRSPRGSPVVAHPRSATPTNGVPGACSSPRRPSDPTDDHHARAAATLAALGAASRVRPEPLKAAMPYNPYNAGVMLRGLVPNPRSTLLARRGRPACCASSAAAGRALPVKDPRRPPPPG